jgi:S-formylglutathione hydrolase
VGPDGRPLPLLVEQGSADPFLASDHPLTLRHQAGYNHSFFFVSSFIDDHLRHHAAALLS